jgi:hypothetical protein
MKIRNAIAGRNTKAIYVYCGAKERLKRSSGRPVASMLHVLSVEKKQTQRITSACPSRFLSESVQTLRRPYMKRRVTTILTFTIGLILVTGIAYAAKRKDQIKPSSRTPDPTHEEEALRAELLAATGDHPVAASGSEEKGAKKIVHATSYKEDSEQIVAKQPEGK